MSRVRTIFCAWSLCWIAGGLAAVGAEPSFSHEVVPTLFKLGCSSGQCHGSFSGKGNFRLSLFAAEPGVDFREVHADFSRRVNPLQPTASLLLQKPTTQMPHGGRLRLKLGSPEYQLILSWIEAGARMDAADTPQILSLRIDPTTISTQLPITTRSVSEAPPAPLRVFAKFTNGHETDVTKFTRFETLDSSIADADENGQVTGRRSGDTHVLAHYAGKIAYTTVLVPSNISPETKFPDEPLNDSIDRLVVEKLKRLNVVPSGLCSDTDFLRRVYLDITGQLPPPEEVRAFLANPSSNKRAHMIDKLLADPLHSAVWANKMCDATGADNRTMYDKSVYRIFDWFRNRFERNVPWDEVVRGALTGSAADNRSADELQAENQRIADEVTRKRELEKELAKEGKKPENGPEQLADKPWRTRVANRNTLEDFSYNLKFRVQAGPRKGQMDPRLLSQHVATAFLGVRLECAECHKHPHDRWTQQDFFGFTTAFAYLKRGVSPEMYVKKMTYINGVYVADEPQETFPDPQTGEPLAPRVLGGDVIHVEEGVDPRFEVWKWMVSPENPYFAKAIVNRVWHHYFGRGLIDPVDSLAEANPPSHPEVLDELVRDFVEHKYDLRHLHRRLLNSRAYQRDWATNSTNATDERNYSHRTLRRMAAEQVLDAVATITGSPLKLDTAIYGGATDNRTIEKAIEMPFSRPRGADSYLLKIFDKPQRTVSCDCERSSNPNLSQALYFYNDTELTTKIADPNSRLTKLLKEITDDNKLLDELYLLTLSRLPTDSERTRSQQHLKESETRDEGFADLQWSLFNRQEFLVTH